MFRLQVTLRIVGIDVLCAEASELHLVAVTLEELRQLAARGRQGGG
jgi:hypothetical protein